MILEIIEPPTMRTNSTIMYHSLEASEDDPLLPQVLAIGPQGIE